MTKLAMLTVPTKGTFATAMDSDAEAALAPGESATFTFTASPGDKLQLMTMFVQSNDWFYASPMAATSCSTAPCPRAAT